MKLTQRLQGTRDRVYKISDKLGMVGHCDVVFTHRVDKSQYTALPRPRLIEPTTRILYRFEQSQTVEVNKDDKMLVGVSRAGLQPEYIYNGGVCNINGQIYTILWVDDNNALDYSILVRPERRR